MTKTPTGGFAGDPTEALAPPASSGGCCGEEASSCCGATSGSGGCGCGLDDGVAQAEPQASGCCG